MLVLGRASSLALVPSIPGSAELFAGLLLCASVAVALSQADQATQDVPNVASALEALYSVQSDYMDGLALGDSDLPGV